MNAAEQRAFALRLSKAFDEASIVVEAPFQQGGNRVYKVVSSTEDWMLLVVRLSQSGYRLTFYNEDGLPYKLELI